MKKTNLTKSYQKLNYDKGTDSWYNSTKKVEFDITLEKKSNGTYRDWETDRKSTRLNSSHRSLSRMPSSA